MKYPSRQISSFFSKFFDAVVDVGQSLLVAGSVVSSKLHDVGVVAQVDRVGVAMLFPVAGIKSSGTKNQVFLRANKSGIQTHDLLAFKAVVIS